jgi:hypothetical protein
VLADRLRVDSILSDFTSSTLLAAETAVYKFKSKDDNYEPKELNQALVKKIEVLEEEFTHLQIEKTTFQNLATDLGKTLADE